MRVPSASGSGQVEVESTPDVTIIRLTVGGDMAEVDMAYASAVKHAAAVLFCAIRHAPSPDAAMALFMAEFQARSNELARSAICAPKGRPS